MVDKLRQNRICRAAIWRLFGLGSDYYPLPWEVLTYDPSQGGYVVDLDKSMLEKAPRYSADQEPRYDRDYGREVYGYYGVPYPF